MKYRKTNNGDETEKKRNQAIVVFITKPRTLREPKLPPSLMCKNYAYNTTFAKLWLAAGDLS